jgi:hypothetical protein
MYVPSEVIYVIALETINLFQGKLCNHTKKTWFIPFLEGCGEIALWRWYRSLFVDDIFILILGFCMKAL